MAGRGLGAGAIVGLEEMELAGPVAELGVMGVALGVVELVEVQQGAGCARYKLCCPLWFSSPAAGRTACVAGV